MTKPTKWLCAQRRHRASLIWVFAGRTLILLVLSYFVITIKVLKVRTLQRIPVIILFTISTEQVQRSTLSSSQLLGKNTQMCYKNDQWTWLAASRRKEAYTQTDLAVSDTAGIDRCESRLHPQNQWQAYQRWSSDLSTYCNPACV